MKPTAALALSWILLASDAAVRAQEFQNLDFEQAMPVLTGDRDDDRYQYAADVLPHWLVEAYDPDGLGAYPVAYNTYGHIGDWPPLIHVFGGDGVSSDGSGQSFRAVAGDYSAMLDPRSTWTSLTQTGMVPVGAQSLRFSGKVYDEPFPEGHMGANVDISLNGVVLPIHELGPLEGATYRFGIDLVDRQVFQYGVNIPPGLAGTTATLKFYVADVLALLVVDDIQFSTVAIPEPPAAVVFGLATLGFVGFARLQQQRCFRRQTRFSSRRCA